MNISVRRFFLGLLVLLGGTPLLRAERYYLSGRDSASAIPWEFKVSSGAKAGEWSSLPVPSNWEMHGFGTLSYHSVEPTETGYYRHRFSAPAGLAGQRVWLVFDGVMTDATVHVNGTLVGPAHQGGFYQFRYEVTPLLHPEGENLLEVEVRETSSNPSVNQAERTGDYWNFGGIFRPVWLEVVPPRFIDHVAVDARADGSLQVDVTMDGVPTGVSALARVSDLTGTILGEIPAQTMESAVAHLRGQIPGIKPWSAETPNLYLLEVELRDPQGERLHHKMTKIGFRTMEVRLGQGFFLNGQRIYLQGANRHSFNARTGRALSEADHREDIELLKGMNMNAVRMSHYPPDTRFLELCDELGLYVLDELAGWQKSYDTETGRRLVEAMVTRDVNHPSILLWDNGNEGGWNTELDQEFGRWDPQQRTVLHPWAARAGVNTAHYKIFAHSRALALGYTTRSWDFDPKEIPQRGDTPQIYLPTEFLHGLFDGGIGAGMEDFWAMMRASPVAGGGFVWALRDEGVLNPFTGTMDVQGNRAPDGVVGPLGEKEASYFTLKKLWSPLVVTGSLPTEGDTMILDFENRYSFRRAETCRYGWFLQRFNPESGETDTVAFGGGACPSLAPGQRGLLHLQLPSGWREHHAFGLTLTDGSGRELWTETWPLPGVKKSTAVVTPAFDDAVPTTQWRIVKDKQQTRVLGFGVEIHFDATSGGLTSYRCGALSTTLAGGPSPLAGSARLVAQEVTEEGGDVLMRQRFEGSLRDVLWRVRKDGSLTCDYTYQPTGQGAAQGISFQLDETRVRAKEWIGDGPYRVWANRRAGPTFGYWKNNYNDTITGWSGWIYPEFKGFFTNVHWLALHEDESRLEVFVEEGAPFVQVLTPRQAPPDLLAETKLDLPTVGLAFLDRIPAIGTKFNRAALLGPQSELKPLPEWLHGRVRFSLRPLPSSR